jgi:hypothetical protein
MAVGFRIINEAGRYQITDETPNYAFLQVVNEGDFTTAGPFPTTAVFAFQSPSLTSQHQGASMVGKCFVFAPCSEIPYTPGGPALDIYNAAGKLMFSSSMRPLVVVDYVEWSATIGSLVKTYASGRDYAVIFLAENISEYGSNNPGPGGGEGERSYYCTNTRMAVHFKVVGNVVTFEVGFDDYETWESIETGLGSSIFIPALAFEGVFFGDGTVGMKALIVDVTGL